jgi:23S rRNA pseudouridine1911/1915/1917 synthase
MEVRVGEVLQNKRLDVVALESIRESGPKWARSVVTRSIIDNLIKVGVLLNGKPAKKAAKVKSGDIVRIDESVLRSCIEESIANQGRGEIIGQKGKLEIVDEAKDWLVLNKPKGVVMHPGIGNYKGTLANFVVGYLQEKGEYDPKLKRGGVVHRLDKGVSGLVVFAKNREFQLNLKKQFENRVVTKIYLASVKKIKDTEFTNGIARGSHDRNAAKVVSEHLNDPSFDKEWYKAEGKIGRDRANKKKMKFSTLSRSGKYSSLYIKPLSEKEFLIALKTGRMHQIRATLNHLGYVIVGDGLYGDAGSKNSDKIELESVLLSFRQKGGEARTLRLV